MMLALAAESVEELDEVAAELEAGGGEALVVPADVTDRASVESLVARVEGGLGPVDLLVTGPASHGPPLEFLAADPDRWWRTVELGVRGPALCSYFVLKRMMPRRRGRIVNLVGDWSLGPAPLLSELACAEAAVLRLTDSLALAAWPAGVSVFAVSAGKVAVEAPAEPEGEGVERDPSGLEAAGRLVAELAGGIADGLTGRFLQVGDDLGELLARSEEVEAEDVLQLRLARLPPPAPEPPPEVAEPAGAPEARGER
jgi:NAD(P)-dependent dehydrogenase (short-subunit alcohol dehydrogenase family)